MKIVLPTILTFLIGHLVSLPAAGSSVLAVSLEQLSTASELIFEGRVVARESSFDRDRTSIHTQVTFQVIDVVKGSYTGAEITLRFLGGNVGEIGLDVADSVVPKVGEVGIYFVESLARFQVNPFYGMDQGHFLILESSTSRVVMTSSRRMITGFLPVGDGTEVDKLSNGVARGLSIDATGDTPSGVTVSQFKLKVLGFLNENQ